MEDNEEGHQGDHQITHQEHQEDQQEEHKEDQANLPHFKAFVYWQRFMHGGEELGV